MVRLFTSASLILAINSISLAQTDSLSGSAQTKKLAKQGSLAARWELDDSLKKPSFTLSPYKPFYFLPVNWSSDPNVMPQSGNPNNSVPDSINLDATELKFQLSTKFKVWDGVFGKHGNIWGAYSQTSRWQFYNEDLSRPFRETNYEPEVMMVFATQYKIAGFHGRLLGIGINHQSNGRSQPLSRSWNRVIAMIGFERPRWSVMIRPWWRIQEASEIDDNPDIEDYMGRGDLTVVYHNATGHQLSLIGRHSLRTGDRSHGSLQFDWALPVSGQFRIHFQCFHGYGESMIDYNHSQTTLGIGFSLIEWM